MTSGNNKKVAYLFAFFAYSIFGLSFLFSKKALDLVSPFVLLATRFTVAFLALNVLIMLKKFKLNLKGKNLRGLLLLGIFQPILYFICEVFGVRLSPTSYVGMIIALVPVASLVLGRVFLKERVTLLQGFFVLLSVLGVVITTGGARGEAFHLGGLLLLLGAVFSAGMFNVISRRMAQAFSAFERTYVMFALGWASFTAIAVVEQWNQPWSLVFATMMNGEFWSSVAFLALASSVGAFLMLNYAVSHLDVVQTAVFANITTVISILAGVFLLGEQFGFNQLLGSIVIIGGAYGVNRPQKKEVVLVQSE